MLGFGKKKDKTAEGRNSPVSEANSPPEIGENGQPVFTKDDKTKARKWFQQGKAVGDSRNYDYAIECYINGLALWPEAVEEGHKPLYGVALARVNTGGKKPGMKDSFRLNMADKDPKKAMLNAETLFAKDPMNVLYMGGVFRNANKGRYDDTMMFMGQIYWDALLRQKKPKPAWLMQVKESYEELGDRCQERGEQVLAVEAYERALKPLELLLQRKPDDLDLSNGYRNLTSKLTITKGKYEEAGSFVDSVRDTDQQKALADKGRLVQADDRLDQLIQKARADLEANPDVPSKVTVLVDLLVRREQDEDENQAMAILQERYDRSRDYRFKQRADEIRMRQMGRHLRQIQKKGDKDAVKRALRKLLKFEIAVYRERTQQYPTDMRVRYQLATRLMRGGLYDDAIPAFQAARADPKTRMRCNVSIGRCFYEKRLYPQATNIFEQAIKDVEVVGDETSRDLYYWMGRSYEAGGKTEDAKKTYGQIIEWDYNYKDVRERLEKLQK